MTEDARRVELSATDYKKLVWRWTTEVWNHRREDVIDEMMAPDCVVQVEGQDGDLSPDDFKAYRRAFLQAVPDMWAEILSVTTEGETSMQCWRVTGTHTGPGLGIPPSGRRVDFTGASFYQFRDGLIVRGFGACAHEYLLAFSCKARYFCPRCHAKRLTLWTLWLEDALLAPGVPHRQVVLTIPKRHPAPRGRRQRTRPLGGQRRAKRRRSGPCEHATPAGAVLRRGSAPNVGLAGRPRPPRQYRNPSAQRHPSLTWR